MIMIDPDKIRARIVAAGSGWSDKEHAASLLEETRKSVRAQIAVKYLEKGDSAAKAELYAEQDQIYLDHLKAMCEARRQANLAKVNYDAGRNWVENLRTNESTRRAEMQLK